MPDSCLGKALRFDVVSGFGTSQNTVANGGLVRDFRRSEEQWPDSGQWNDQRWYAVIVRPRPPLS